MQVQVQVQERRGGAGWFVAGGGGGEKVGGLTRIKTDPLFWVVVWLQLSKASMTESVYAATHSVRHGTGVVEKGRNKPVELPKVMHLNL